MSGLSQELLKEYFEYKGGNLWWIKNRPGSFAGKQFGSTVTGYRHGRFFGKRYYEHKLVWLYHYGYWPKELDHINGVRDDNRIENLREVTRQQNMFNRPSKKGSSSKYKGVCWNKNAKKWVACHQLKGEKTKHLGYFTCELAAAKAYDDAVREYQGIYRKENL